MSRPFTTVKLLNAKEPLHRQMTCEVRFQDGYLYLDHCGRLLRKLLRDGAEWIVTPEPVPQGTAVLNVLTGSTLRFGARSAAITLDRTSADEVITADEAEHFIKQVGVVLEMVIDEFEITELTRVGYRELYYFQCDTKEESEKWIGDLGLFSVSPNLLQAFDATPDALGAALVVQGKDCHYRIALNGVERTAQIPVGESSLAVRESAVPKKQKRAILEAMKKQRQRQINTAFAAVLDIDAFLLEPEECDLAAFVRERTSTNLPMFRDAVEKEA